MAKHKLTLEKQRRVDKIKHVVGNLCAVLYFLSVMWWLLLLLMLDPIMQVTDIYEIRNYGFSTFGTAPTGIWIYGLFIGLSLLVPALRRIYYKFPWMFTFVKIAYLNALIMMVAVMLLNYGYEVQNPTRHNLFFILMICQIIICRILMCAYFSRKKVQYVGGSTNE